MKKLIGSSLAIVALAFTSNATTNLFEPFAYSDGTLTSVSAGAWFAHSGAGSGAVQVSGGEIILNGSNAEDISRAITPGTVFSNQTLYGSFTVNFSALPTANTYFAHLSKDATTFRAKIFSTISNSTPGSFRLGIANSANTPIVIASDLSTGTDYKVVWRMIGSTNATLWIGPTSEASVVNRADALDAAPIGSYWSTNYSFREATGIGTMTISNLLIGTQFSDVQTIGGPPSISGLVATSIPANGSTGPMPFVISDVETPNSDLTVTATSDNTTLVPNNPANLTFGGPFTNSTLTVTPAASQEGVANIQVVVTDNLGDKATNTFALTVGSPSISSIANKITPAGTPTSVNLWVNDNETAAGSLTVTATSSDQTVLPDANIGVVNSGNTNRTLMITNAAAGFAVVTVTVSDGTFNIPTTFILTAAATNGILLADDFSYADGSIVTNSLGNTPYPWQPNTGLTGQVQVVSGKLLLTNNGSEDIYRFFTNAPYATNSGQVLYTRFVVNLSTLPTASGIGEYFSHVYAFSGQYRARLFANTNGAAPGKYRINITSAGFAGGGFPQDLSLNEPHVVIARYNTATAEATLWVDPASESSTSVNALDVSTPTTVYGISFRQQSGIGSMSIDDLLVGSSFGEVFLDVPNANADLASLTLSDGTLAPAFAAGTTSYTASVPNATSSITVTPTVADALATIEARVNGGSYASVTSGSPSGALALNVGANTVDVKVTAEDATTIKTYTVTVTRAAAPPTPETVTFTTSGTDLILSWSQNNWTGLLTGTNVTGVTNPLPGVSSPYTNAISGPQTYFRLYYTAP